MLNNSPPHHHYPPSLEQNNTLIRNKLEHTHTYTHKSLLQSFIFWSQASLSSWHYALTECLQWGRRLSTAEIISKCPTLIWSLWKEPTSWVNSMKGHSAEACMGVQLQYHLSDLWVCSLQHDNTGPGCTHYVVLQHICLITSIHLSNLNMKKWWSAVNLCPCVQLSTGEKNCWINHSTRAPGKQPEKPIVSHICLINCWVYSI